MSNPNTNEPTHSLGDDPERTRSTAPSPGTPRPAAANAVPARIGRYTIVRVLGEGGMGTVYEAQQESPKRTVALKVIRAGYLSPELLRRFTQESQVLGRLQHPGIAQVYEAGVFVETPVEPPTAVGGPSYPRPSIHHPPTSVGGSTSIPFFAMEFIRGVPLTEYVNQKALDTRDRLELVAKVCDAVYHAHQKGVIHRDLKPGNILVDESGQPKILDFGIARATDSDIQQTTLQTDIGQLIGTIPYMSPEQVSGDPNDLDTRSDVYALGVIAYEILAGRLPYDLQRKMIHEAARIIREEEPTRLSSINRTLRGDVETIVAKALEKDKVRRYQSAESLASDIRRYLKDEPIAARPASTWYQAAKFSRRNRALVGGVAASFMLLVGGVIATAWQANVARGERDRAVVAEKETSKRADELKQVSDFQAQMLAQVDPTAAGERLTEDVMKKFDAALEKQGVPREGGERATRVDEFRVQWRRVNATDAARELIDRTILRPAADAIEKQFKDQPLVDATLRQTLSDRYRDLGMYEAAVPLQESSLKTRRRELGDDHPDTLSSINNLACLLRDQGKLAEAEPLCREAMARGRRVLGKDDPDMLVLIDNTGILLHRQGRLDEAEPFLRETLDSRRRVLGDRHPGTVKSINNLGVLLRDRGRLNEAEPYLREALAQNRILRGNEDLSTLTALSNLGMLLGEQGKAAEAEACLREALDTSRRVLGEENPDTLTALRNVGDILLVQGRPGEAERCLLEAVEMCRRTLGDDHPDTLSTINSMGLLLQRQGKLAEAEPYLREALETSRRVLGDVHPGTIGAINNLSMLLKAQNRLGEAEPYMRELVGKARLVLGVDHPNTLTVMGNLGGLLAERGKEDEAEPYLREALEKRRRVLGNEHPHTMGSIMALGFFLQKKGALGEAEPYLREAVQRFRLALGEQHPDTLNSINNLGLLLRTQGRYTEAVELLAASEPAARTTFTGDNARGLGALLLNLGAARMGLGVEHPAFAAAEANLLEAHAIFVLTRGESHLDTRRCVLGIEDLYNTPCTPPTPGRVTTPRRQSGRQSSTRLRRLPSPPTLHNPAP